MFILVTVYIGLQDGGQGFGLSVSGLNCVAWTSPICRSV